MKMDIFQHIVYVDALGFFDKKTIWENFLLDSK